MALGVSMGFEFLREGFTSLAKAAVVMASANVMVINLFLSFIFIGLKIHAFIFIVFVERTNLGLLDGVFVTVDWK